MPSLRAFRDVFAALLILGAGVGSAGAQAQKVTVHFDPAQTHIGWTLKATGHTVHGTFKLKGGMVIFDPATGIAQGELLVDAASGESGDGARDKKMKKEVLEVEKYPEVFFHATKISGAILGAMKPGERQDLAAEGAFNIHGQDHNLKLELKIKLEGNRATATTHFVVPYVAWGMKNPSAFVFRVAKEVNVDVLAVGTVEGLEAH